MTPTVKDVVMQTLDLLAVVRETQMAHTGNLDFDTAFVWATTGSTDPILTLIGQHAGDLDVIDGDIADLTRTLVDTVERAAQAVRRGDDVSAIGVVQATGARLDALYGRRAGILGALKMAAHAWTRANARAE